MLRLAGAWAIRLYQRHLSPRKGYHCAYGVLHGDGTCSSIGLGIMQDQGVFAFFRQMPLQFDACRAASAALNAETPEQREERRRKRAENRRRYCNDGVGCDGCDDLGDCEPPCSFSEIAICESVGSGIECDSCEFGSCD